MLSQANSFEGWVLIVVGMLVVGGVIASIKSAIDVAVIKQMLKNGEGRFDRQDREIEAVRIGQKKYSERIRKLEHPPSNPHMKPLP